MEKIRNKCSYEVEITGVTAKGSGVGNIGGFVIFVPGTVTGDIVRAFVAKVNKSYAYGIALDIIKPSEHRCEPICPVAGLCGGCSMMHIDYNYQLEIKKEIIENAVKRIGEIDHAVDEMIGAKEPLRYRNKMIFPVGTKDGKPVCGFYREHSHYIIPLSDCYLGNEFNAGVMRAVSEYMRDFNVSPYNEKRHKGVIRRIFTRCGKASGEIMVVISVNADTIPGKEELVERLRAVSGKIVSVILNINKEKTNLVLGRKNVVIYGKGSIADRLLGIDYEISPHSFYQINPDQTELLYSKALEYADIKNTDTVLDIYCGIGTISLSAAKSAGEVIGVEIVPEAIENAKENAKNNGIKNAEFFCADAAEIVPKLIDSGKRPDVVILDPPRKGSDEKTLSAIAKASPKRIVYVSCNPATLARDMKFLEEHGYSTEKICGVDMFPQTGHIETVALLSRQKA